MIWIDYRDARPIYEQVVERFKILILKGVLKPDEKMPSVRSLAMELAINPNTIQRAYMELERQGYIYAVKGRGNFVSDRAALLEGYQKELEKRLKELYREALAVEMTREELIRILHDTAAEIGQENKAGSAGTYTEEGGKE